VRAALCDHGVEKIIHRLLEVGLEGLDVGGVEGALHHAPANVSAVRLQCSSGEKRHTSGAFGRERPCPQRWAWLLRPVSPRVEIWKTVCPDLGEVLVGCNLGDILILGDEPARLPSNSLTWETGSVARSLANSAGGSMMGGSDMHSGSREAAAGRKAVRDRLWKLLRTEERVCLSFWRGGVKGGWRCCVGQPALLESRSGATST
jgi:hypothetical protein